MRINIHYFSGTGNTAEAARCVHDVAGSEGHDVRLMDIEQVESSGTTGSSAAVPPADLTVVLFPVYSWSPPAIMRRYLRSLHARKHGDDPTDQPGSRMAIIAVDGGGGGGAAKSARRIAERRGFDVFFTARIGYPVNWRQFARIAGGEAAGRTREAGDSDARTFAREILEGKRRHYVPPRAILLISGLSGLFFRFFGRQFMSQLFVADDRCTGCRLCQRTCPVGAISIAHRKDARPVWKTRCESCNRCINICPERAIVTSWGRIGVSLTVIGLLLAGWFIASPGVLLKALPEAGSSGWIRVGSAIIGVVLVHYLSLVILPPLFWCIDRLPGGRRFMSYGFNGKWEQNIAPGFHPHQRL